MLKTFKKLAVCDAVLISETTTPRMEEDNKCTDAKKIALIFCETGDFCLLFKWICICSKWKPIGAEWISLPVGMLHGIEPDAVDRWRWPFYSILFPIRNFPCRHFLNTEREQIFKSFKCKLDT